MLQNNIIKLWTAWIFVLSKNNHNAIGLIFYSVEEIFGIKETCK